MKFNKFLLFTTYCLLLTVFFFSIHSTSLAYTFNTDLNLGDQGADILELQKFLNSHSNQTKVADTGIGSSGNETNYFGNLTKLAIINFQNLYREQILTPVGLRFGTGFVGPSTRAWINSLQNSTEINENNTENQSSANNFDLPEFPTVMSSVPSNNYTTQNTAPNISQGTGQRQIVYVSNYRPLQGEIISIYGENVAFVEALDFNGSRDDFECDSSFVCEYQIPANLPIGKYQLQVIKNNSVAEFVEIEVKDKNTPKPEIFTKNIKINGDNLIKGKNLTEDIRIESSIGVFNSKTLNNQFILNPGLNLDVLPEYIKNGFIKIINSDGTISESYEIEYEK